MVPEKLLKIIEEYGSFPVNKNTSEEEIKSLNKLKAYELVQKKNKYSWELSSKGHLAIENGGYLNYVGQIKKSKTENLNNHSVIDGNNNTVYQSNHLEKNNEIKPKGFWSKIWWSIIVPIVIGILLLLIESNILNI